MSLVNQSPFGWLIGLKLFSWYVIKVQVMRSFTIVAARKTDGSYIQNVGGRYLNNTPSGAARKAFTKLSREYLKPSGRASLEIHLRETTQNSSKKVFKYKVSRMPKKTDAGWIDEDLVFAFTTKVKAV